MERDEQFEIQYLISVIIAVIGAITANNIQKFIDIWIAIIFLILVFLHLVSFNIYYTFASATDFEIDSVNRLRGGLRWTIAAITSMFLFFVFHMIGNIALELFTGCRPDLNIVVAGLAYMSFCSQAKIVISYAVPTLGIVVLGLVLGRGVGPTINLFKNLNFTVSPSSVRVFYDFDETEPLLIKVENHTSAPQSLQVQVDLPEDVIADLEGVEKRGTFTKSLMVDAERQAKINLQLKYRGRERRRDIIDIDLIHDKGRKNEEIEVLLVD